MSRWLIATLLILAQCAHDGSVRHIRVESEVVQDSSLPATDQLKKLEQYLQLHPEAQAAVADVQWMLRAKTFMAAGRLNEAQAAWANALELARASFGKKALEGWAQTFQKRVLEPEGIAVPGDLSQRQATLQRMLAALPKNAPYLRSKREQKLEKALGWAKPKDAKAFYPPSSEGIPGDDRLLLKLAKGYCAAAETPAYLWQAWYATLLPAAQGYWKGLTLLCQGQVADAMALLEEISPELAAEPSTRPFAIIAYDRLAVLQRRNDQRAKVAGTYQALTEVWRQPGITPTSLGMTDAEFLTEKINHLLWAARYQTLMAEYGLATDHLARAKREIVDAPTRLTSLSQETKAKLTEFAAEAAYIQSFRFFAPQKKYQEAYQHALTALSIPKLPSAWRTRFDWTCGLYAYYTGDFKLALLHWGQLQDRDAKVLFWSARAHQALGEQGEAENLRDQLREKHPLSFYTVTAPSLAGQSEQRAWHESFKPMRELRNRLAAKTPFHAEELGNTPWLEKTEALGQAGLTEWAKLAGKALYSHSFRKFSLAKNPETFLYLSRLLYVSGNYRESISTTQQLKNHSEDFWEDWGEQLFVFFPRPYAPIFFARANYEKLDPSLLLAIARQESSFDAGAESSAAALGLMQIIVPTALRMAAESDLFLEDPRQDLLRPAVSIHLGARYLSKLSAHYEGYLPAVIAAYNAGEFAVDRWLTNGRPQDTLEWVEFIPFGQTRHYVKSVWRNITVYNHMHQERQLPSLSQDGPAQAPPLGQQEKQHGNESSSAEP